MNKKLRLRISRVISTFKACRPKSSAASAAAASPPVFHVDFPTPPPPRPSPSRRMAAAVASVRCRSFAAAPAQKPARWAAEVDAVEDDLSRARETPAYLWRKEEKWHVVNVSKEEESGIERRRKIDCDDDEEGDDLFPTNDIRKTAASRRRKREMEIRRRRRGQRSLSHRNSTSSVASGSWFSSDDDEENDERSEEFNRDNEDDDDGEDTDTLLSSRSFSTDSSVVNKPRPSSGAAAVLSRLVPCGADSNQAKVVKESFAVVKRSEDPRADFRCSMAEMVVEKGIYDAADLEQLLSCFLSLNSRRHHRAIVSAFADIWEAIFPESSPHVNDCT